MGGDNFIDSYLNYIGESESPAIFHRWAALSILGTWLGRRYYFPFGHENIYCNMYVMLMGNAGARKSTAIKIAAKLIKQAGYTNIAAEKTTKEKFLLDLAGDTPEEGEEDILTVNLFGADSEEDREILIAADEFNTFVGNGNIEFLSLLGVLWDYNGPFKNRVKNSSSVSINNPTVSMLAGNTPTGFSLAFPPEAIGQGIFSRLLLIHGEKTGKRITFPRTIPAEETKRMLTQLEVVRSMAAGEAIANDATRNLLDKIYQTYTGVSDVRFESYNNRRFTHLLKLCMLVSAAFFRNEITESDVLYANTILVHAEHHMLSAIGEFGKAKNSDVTHKVMSVLETVSTTKPVVTFAEIWKNVHSDLSNPDELKNILAGLTMAGKVMHVTGGFIGKRTTFKKTSEYVDFSLLTEEERGGIT